MTNSLQNRCGYTWPEDDIGDEAISQSCCWRKTVDGVKKCLWHADTDDITKSADDLQQALAPTEIREQNYSHIDNENSFATELLDGAELSNLEINEAISFEGVALRDGNLSGADLRGSDLCNANLRDADLSDADLSGADLSDAYLLFADLSDAVLFNTDLNCARLRYANLNDAQLRHADFSDAILIDSNLTDADIQSANLRDTSLLFADLTGAWLNNSDLSNAAPREADFTDANLKNTDLIDANLKQADLTGADLYNADLSGANLDGTDLSGATLRDTGFDSINLLDTPSELLPTSTLLGSVPSLIDAEVDWRDTPVEEYFRIPVPGYGNPASFVEAELRRADLEGAKLNYANLSEAALTAADCENVQFNEANLQRATLENADISGTNFSDAYLYQTQFDGARINEKTQFHPDGGVGDTKTDNACRYDSKVPPQTAVDSVAESAEADSDADVEEVRARQARSTYTRLEDLARENGFPDLKSEMYIRRQDARRELLWAQGEKLQAVFARIQKSLFNYGESFRRIVEISVAAIVIAWMLFMTTGTVENAAGVVVTPGVVIDNPILVWETLYHSLSVFFAGQGPLSPIGTSGQVLTVFLRATGPILVALLIFVLGRRAAR